jgi:phytoene synthase
MDRDGVWSWQRALEAAREALRSAGVPVPPLEGKLLRPRLAWALLTEDEWGWVGPAFAYGALAIQMAHEASLLHDDIVDGARIRRGRTTAAEDRGLGYALLQGDHWLTAAYRAAAAGPPGFLEAFVEAVERTVAGEAEQVRRTGEPLDPAAYRAVIRGKSGELFGAAAVLAGAHRGIPREEARKLGCDVGALYQMVDDLLDYCPRAATGKPAFQDYRQRKYTFVLAEAGIEDFSAPVEAVEGRLFDGGPRSPMARALERLDGERRRVAAEGRRLFGHDGLSELLTGWLEEARAGVEAHRGDEVRAAPASGARPERTGTRPVGSPRPDAAEARRDASPGGEVPPEVRVAEAARQVGGPDEWGAYFGRHSKSFRFAARLFPPEPRSDVEGVYAFCRFTDDLVDEARGSTEEARARLEAWRSMVRAAYDGTGTGIPLADVVMGRMAEGGAPFHYVDDLLTGVGMDLAPPDYPTLEALETYTYRVAGVVGGWITELFGLHDPPLLRRAYAMGHAMQLTNILRDVGEDWRRGRLYLPLDLLAAHGIDTEEIKALSERGVVPEGWPEAMEELMGVADRHYRAAFEAIPFLPTWYRRPVAVAARVYQGIQDEIRRNGYDNGSLRAHTSLLRKLRLGWGGLRDLRRALPAPGVPEVTVLEALASRDGGEESMAR